MADYWISFCIKYDSEASYQKRYREFSSRVETCATGGMWETDTSFIAIRSEHGINAIGNHLKKALNGTTDHLVIREIGKVNTRYINDPGDGFLAFFPEAIKL